MPDLKQALKDYVATSNSGKYSDEKELNSKFPELNGYDAQSLKDYVATSNSGKYQDEETLNSKFPEFFTPKKKASSNWGSDSQPKDTATSLVSGEWTKTKTPSKKVAEKVKTTTKTPNYFPKVDTNGLAPGEGTQFDYNAEKAKEVVAPEVKYKEGSVAWNHQKMIENNPDYVSNYDKFKQVKKVSDAKKAEIAQDNEDEFNGVGIWNNIKSFGREAFNTTIDAASNANPSFTPFLKSSKMDEDPFADQKAKAKKEFQDEVLLAKKNKEVIPVFTNQDINKRAKEIKLQERIDSQSETQIKDFLQKDNETGGLQKNRFQSFEIGNYATIQEKDKVLLEQQNIERNVIKGLEGELKGLEQKLTENGLSPENLKLYKEKNNSLTLIKSEYDKADSDFKNSDQYKNYIKKSEELKPIDVKYKSINAELEKAKLDIEDARKNKDSKKESELITIYNQKVKESNAVREQYNTIYDGIKDNSFIGNYNKNIEEIRSRYNNAYKEVSELSKTVNKSNQVSVEYNEKYKKYQEVITESIATHNKYVSNRKDLGTATENLDILKRDYGFLKSFIGNIDAVTGDLTAGIIGAVDYALEAKKNILGYQTGNDIYAQKIAQGVVGDLKSDSDKVRAEIMKPITVDNINNLSDLGDWFFQTAVAQQVPIYGIILTGGIGVGAIGVSSGGQRLNDMRVEMERGEKQYTDTELMVHPVGFAITETASAAVDLMILKNAARVISSATRPERQMIANGFAKRVMTVGGAMVKGGGFEGFDEGLTKGGQNLIEGKPFMEGMVDPIAAGSVMGMLIPFGGHLFAEATKPFSTDTKIQEASAEILNLQNELDKPNLSDETRALIKDNLAKTQVKVEALMKKQIGKIESLSKEQFQEILKNEKTQANIKQQAEGIQLDESISTDTKKQLLTNLKAEFKAQNERRMDLLARGASVQMERLDPAESIRLKNLAAKRLMKEQNPDGTKNITLEDEEISRTAIQIRNAEIKEQNLINARDKELSEREKAKQTESQLPTVPENYNIVDAPVVNNNLSLEEKEKETREKIKRKDLFDNVGDFSSSLGGSDIAAVPVSHKEKNGIEFIEYAHPKTGSIDVVATGVSDNDFVGYYRIYENGKPTDKWSSKFENKSRNKENFKTMIGGVQSMLPEGHQYTETTSISTDGLRVWEQQLSRGYELQTDTNGNLVTNEVAINGDAIVNELGIDVNQGNFDNISVTNNQQFQSVKKALLPYLQKFGLNESNIRNVNGTVEIDLPVLRKTKNQNQATPPVEDVVATSVEKPTDEQQFEDVKNGNVVSFTYGDKSEIPEIFKDKISSEGEINGKKEIKVTIAKSLAEYHLQNEATPPTDNPTNGNVRIEPTNVGESGITEQESPSKEGVSKPVDGGEVKGDAEVVKKVKSVKGATYDVHFDGDGNISKIISPKNGREIIKFTEREVNDTDAKGRKQYNKDGTIKKKKVLVTNPNYAQIEADALGLPTVNKEKAGKVIDFKVAVDNISETDPFSVALKALVNGAKVSFESIVKETGNKDGKWATNQSDKTLPSIEKLSEQLWGQNPDLDQQEIRNAIIDIISSHSNINSVKESVVEIYNENARKQQEQELHAFLGSLSEKDMAMYQALQAEDSYFEALTDKELDEYHNQKINEYEQGQQEIARGETANEKPEIIVEGNEEKGGIENKPTTKEKIAERIKLSDAKIDNIKDAINGIDSIFGIKIKVDDIDGLNKNGVDIVEVIANIVKQAMAAGIQIDEAISKTIEHLKKTIDFDVNIDDIKERISPKKEESKSNDSRREKNSSEKASDLGINEKQYLDLGDKIKEIPETGVFKKYLSGDTIEREYGTANNDQSYDAVTLQDIAKHGDDVINQAKELFGDAYIEKTLDYLQSANLNSFEKGVVFASLENLMDTKVKSDPKNKQLLKLQELVYADSQANLRSASLGINTGRLRSVYNAIKNGVDIDKIASQAYTDKQKEAKVIIEGAVPNGENLNKATDVNENSVVDADLEALISEGVDKQINEIYKKLPSNRRVKVDKAITALENIQKRLRTNTYDASIGLPIAIIDAGITVIKNSIKAGVNISDAIEIGINHIKAKYGKNWEKEDDFRKDMHDGFNTEGIDAKERSAKEKTKIKGIKETVKQALIDAGFYREIKTKNGVNKVLDWVKLVGRDASVEGLKKNVEEQLKKQGFDDAKIAEISDELEIEYKRLAKDILDKATADLERRNLIKPSPNRKSDNQRLVDLYNEGLFGDNIKKYENAVNRILGFSDVDNANYDKIKQKLFALSELYKAKNKGEKISEQSINAVSNEINHAISNIMAVSSFQQGNIGFKIASLAHEYAVLAQKALLGGIKTLAENVISGDYAASSNRINTDSYMTPELKKQIKANVKAVKNDIVENAGLYYGDVTTSLVTHSIIEDLINQKITSKVGHVIMSAITLRRWLDAKDSAIKVRLTDALFVKNAVDILTNKTNPNGAMSKEDAVKFVSEALTGDSFDKALVAAKNIIDDVNSRQEVKQLKDNPEAIHRFAMEIVRENLMSGNKMSMSEIEASFKAAYKSAGRSIGHEANNIISKQVNMGNAHLSSELNKAISNKDYPKATMLMVQSLIMRAIVQPFAGGGANWTVIGAEKGVPIIGYISTAYNYVSKKPLELNSVTGVKNLQESLFRENSFKESAVRNVIATGMAVVAYAAMIGYKDDDDETNAKKFNDWLNKPENKWVRPYFNKLSPTAFSFIVAMEDENLGRYLAQLFGNSGDSFDNTLKVIKATDSKKEGAMAGATGKLVGQPFSSPFAWKPIKDAVEIYKGLNGIVPKKKSYKVNGFMNGYLQGGLLEQLGLRPDLKNDFDSPEAKLKEKQDKIKDYNNLPESEKIKVDANNRMSGLRGELSTEEKKKFALESNTPYYEKGSVDPVELNIDDINGAIEDIKAEMAITKKQAGSRYKPPKEE